MKLSGRVRAVKASPTLAIAAEAKARKARGEDIVGFGAGEPDFDTPAFIKRAAIDALEGGFTKYTATGGIPELRQAICDKLRDENRFACSPEQVLVSCGAKQSLYNLFQAVVDPGDEVVIPSPYWVSYPDMVLLAGGRPVFAQASEEEGFQISAAAIERALTPSARILVLNSPSNPTGAVLGRRRPPEIAELVASRPGLLVVSDDIYEHLIYSGEPFENLSSVAPALAERTVLVNGFSKTFAMTGWRMGYAAGPKELIAAMGRIQDQSTSNATSFVQKGALAALQGGAEGRAILEGMRGEFDRRRRRMVSLLREIPGVRCVEPLGAFYAFPNVEGLLGKRLEGRLIGTDGELCSALLDRGVAAVPGSPFGAPGHVRLSFALALSDIEKGLARISKLAAELA
ncbi:MAG: pyridoxal phosphate-dependent aminotransferase [Deltaproteobacteria bacterium]